MKQYLNRNMNIGVALAKAGRECEEQCSKPRKQHMQRQEGRKRSTFSIQTKVQDVCRLGLRDGERADWRGQEGQILQNLEALSIVCATPRARGSHQKVLNSELWAK